MLAVVLTNEEHLNISPYAVDDKLFKCVRFFLRVRGQLYVFSRRVNMTCHKFRPRKYLFLS